MRKLLIFLSVVLAVSLCQGTKRPTRKLPATHIFNPSYCIFGIKKVNGTRKCRTKEEFFQHPKNDTNCSIFKELKCYEFKNTTACICVKKVTRNTHPPIIHKCQPGFIWRCKRERYSRKSDCSCTKLYPVRGNGTNKCPGIKICPKKGPCYCDPRRASINDPIDPVAF